MPGLARRVAAEPPAPDAPTELVAAFAHGGLHRRRREDPPRCPSRGSRFPAGRPARPARSGRGSRSTPDRRTVGTRSEPRSGRSRLRASCRCTPSSRAMWLQRPCAAGRRESPPELTIGSRPLFAIAAPVSGPVSAVHEVSVSAKLPHASLTTQGPEIGAAVRRRTLLSKPDRFDAAMTADDSSCVRPPRAETESRVIHPTARGEARRTARPQVSTEAPRPRAVVVSADPAIRDSLRVGLATSGVRVVSDAPSAASVAALLEARRPTCSSSSIAATERRSSTRSRW